MSCHGCNQPLEPLAQVRTYHSGCDPHGRVEMLERNLNIALKWLEPLLQTTSEKMLPTLRREITDMRAALDYRPAQMGRVETLERTIKEMIEAIPGGQYCDPQEVADTLRAIADAALDYRPAQMKESEG